MSLLLINPWRAPKERFTITVVKPDVASATARERDARAEEASSTAPVTAIVLGFVLLF